MIRRTLLFLLLSACTASTPPTSDSGGVSEDSGIPSDSGIDTSQPVDTADTSTPEASSFPDIQGDCDVLGPELSDEETHTFSNSLDFGMAGFDEEYLSAGGAQIYETDNAGGSSIFSEVFAFELLFRCENAALLKTETEISYTTTQGKITDLLVEIDATKIGVSVTRAFAYPPDTPYTPEMAEELLEKKLSGILESSENVAPEDAWEKQILHVLAYTADHQQTVLTTYADLDPALKADTILLVTATEGEDSFLY